MIDAKSRSVYFRTMMDEERVVGVSTASPLDDADDDVALGGVDIAGKQAVSFFININGIHYNPVGEIQTNIFIDTP